MAILNRSSSVTIRFFFSKPPIIRSTALMKSSFVMTLFSCLAAIRAASLHTLAISAPEKPGVWRANCSISQSRSNRKLRMWTAKISLRSFISGRSTEICLSKRPARSKALSSTSTRLVAAKTITPLFEPNPSISVSNWLSVLSRSSLPPILVLRPRALPTASISSIKTIQGALLFA